MAELLSETPLNDEQREYVRVFRRAGDNLLNVINDILDFSKVEAGQIEMESIEFDLAEVVAEALEIAGVRARAKGLRLSSRIQPNVPARLIGDPGRLRQILFNLLGNANKFTERGEVSVGVEMDSAPATLHFAVSDTGYRNSSRSSFQHLRKFLAGRCFHHAQVRRHWPGSRDLQAIR